MFFDAQNFNALATMAFDPEGRLLRMIYTMYNSPEGDPSGEPQFTVPLWQSTVSMNLQDLRSSVSWGYDLSNPVMKASQVRRLFSVSNLTGGR